MLTLLPLGIGIIVLVQNCPWSSMQWWNDDAVMTEGKWTNRPLSSVHTSNNVEATFDFVKATFDFVTKNGNNVERVYCKISSFGHSRMLLRHCCRFWQQCCWFRQCSTISIEISSFRQSRDKLNVFSLFRFCRKDEILSENGNDVEETFDFVDRMVPFDNVASTLLLVWTGL